MRWFACLVGLAAGLAHAGDWRDTLLPPQPGSFPPPRPQRCLYRFGWGLVTAAEAEIELSRLPREQYELKAALRTVGAVRPLWQMNAEHTARCTAPGWRPLWLQQTEIYKKKTEKIRVDFSPLELMRYREVSPPETPPPQPRRFELPHLFDLQTALFYVRSQRLDLGEVHRLTVYPAKSGFLAKVTVLAREKLRLKGQSRPAIKLQVELQRITKNLELEPHDKFKSAAAWFSDDPDRTLLKVEAQVFVGSVWVELQSQTFTGD